MHKMATRCSTKSKTFNSLFIGYCLGKKNTNKRLDYKGDARIFIGRVQNISIGTIYAPPSDIDRICSFLAPIFHVFCYVVFWLERPLQRTIFNQNRCNAPVAKFWRVQIHPLHPFCRRRWISIPATPWTFHKTWEPTLLEPISLKLYKNNHILIILLKTS